MKYSCHPRPDRGSINKLFKWIPAFAGMTMALLLFTSSTIAAELPTCGTSHENALCKTNQGLLPPELASTATLDNDPNILQRLLLKISELTAKLGFRPKFPGAFHPRSEAQDQIEVPSELLPSGPPEEQLPGYLGGNSGIWGDSLPAEINSGETKTEGYEKSFEKATFPEGITPITGQ